MRFVADRKGITPLLASRAPLSTLLRNDGPSSNNPDVRESVLRGDRQVLAWAYARLDGGRGFAFTGGHHHRHYRDDNFRKTVLNGVAWVAGLEVPADGVESTKPTWEEIAPNQDYQKPESWEEEAGLKMSGSADPVYSTPLIPAGSEPVELEVEIPPARFRGERGNESPLPEEMPGQFIGPSGPQDPPALWSESDIAMEIPAPSLVYYPVPRGSTHFLAKTSYRADGSQSDSGRPQDRVHVFFAPPAERHFGAP